MFISVHTVNFEISWCDKGDSSVILFCTAMNTLSPMLLRTEWQFGIYIANWYMSNVYNRFSKQIGGGSFPVPFLINHVYTVSDSVYTVSDHVYTVLSHVYTRLSENATGKLPPPILLLY